MQTALTVFWVLLALGFAVGVVITIVALVRAPEGFEDETGFHNAEPKAGAGPAVAPDGHAVRPSHPELA